MMLHLKNIGFDGIVKQRPLSGKFKGLPVLRDITLSFSYGKVYLLNTDADFTISTLIWITCGLLEQDNGVILRDEAPYSAEDRRKDACCVRQNVGKRFLFWQQTIGSQIREGLRRNRGSGLSEEEIIQRFHLSVERYNRPLTHLSAEAWLASCAIGFAEGKTLFGFAHVPPEVLRPRYIPHFKEVLRFIRDAGALVLIPTMVKPEFQEIGDEILQLHL